MIRTIALSALFGAVLVYLYGLKEGIVGVIALLLILHLVGIEPFDDASDPEESRWLMYGDSSLFWNNQNAFMRMNSGDFIDESGRLARPTEVPRTWIWEFWTVEDLRDARWRMGNTAPVKYGDKIGLRSWKYNWLRANDGGALTGAGRDAQCALVIESADGKSNAGTPVRYGDLICLKTYNGTYISRPTSTSRMAHIAKKDNTCIFTVYDSYGQGAAVDWATRGFATQAPIYDIYDANLAIDGNPQTFSHTQQLQGAWWQVELPRDIVIDTVNVQNRRDCCQDRLNNFDVIVTNSDGAVVYTKYFKDTQESYTIAGIGHIGRTVRVQLRGNGMLHLAEVSVYGTPVKYSNIAESQVVADLISSEKALTIKQGVKIHPISIPHIGKNNSMSVSMFIKPESDGAVLKKGNFQIKLVNSRLTVQVGTATGLKTIQSGTPLNKSQWNHLAVIVKPAIGPSTGWLYGEFDTAPAGTPGTCCYVVHPIKREYYYTKLPIPNAVKTKWSASFVENMKYKGELMTNSPTLTLYVNGNLDTLNNLEADAKLENHPIHVGHHTEAGEEAATDGFAGAVSMLRFYNYAVDPGTVSRDSHMQYDVTTVDLVRGTADGRTVKTVGAYLLPSVSKEVSVSLWLLSQRAPGEKDQVIYRQGNTASDQTPSLSLRRAAATTATAAAQEQPTAEGDRLVAPVQIVGAADGGVGELNTAIKSGVWYHVTQVIQGRVHTVYVNGRKVDSVQLTNSPKLVPSSIHIGGFTGLIRDLRYHNFALSEEEVRGQMGVHPDYVERESLSKMWQSLGCLSDIFSTGLNTDSMIALIKDHNTARVEATLRELKAAADKGDKTSQGVCYGSGMVKLYTELENTKRLLTHTSEEKPNQKICLPTAPFQCKTQEVNDFDIRTHKDFYKYTETSQVQPPLDQPELNQELARTRKALADMTELRQRSVASRREALAEGEAALDKLLRTGASAEEIRTARRLTLVRTAQGFYPGDLKDPRALKDLKEIQDTPVFREILSQVLNRYFAGQEGGPQSKEQLAKLEAGLKAQSQQLEVVSRNARKIAQNMMPGLSEEAISNILASKGELSGNPEYQKLLQNMKSYDKSAKGSEEYQELAKKLNVLSTGEIEKGGKPYQDFKVQSHKCAAMFQCGQVNLPKATLLKMFSERVKGDPQFRALIENIVASTSKTDQELYTILKKAEQEQYTNDPKFQEFLVSLTKSQIEKNPVYLKTLENMIGPDILKEMQLKSHPQYAKYAAKLKGCPA